MATVVLAAGASALAKGLGAGAVIAGAAYAAGAMIGGAIDAKYTYPYLFPPDVQTPDRLDALNLQSASEGSPVHYCRGSSIRMAGTVIWTTDREETAHKQSGKGGTKRVVSGYTYSCDCAVAICEGEINKVKKIWADGKLFFSEVDDLDITSAVISIEGSKLYHYPETNCETGPQEDQHYMTIESPNGGPDLTQFQSGPMVIVSGCTNSQNNGTFRCIKAWAGDAGKTYMRLLFWKWRLSFTIPTFAVGKDFRLLWRDVSIYTYTVLVGDTAADIVDALVAGWNANKPSSASDVLAVDQGNEFDLDSTEKIFQSSMKYPFAYQYDEYTYNAANMTWEYLTPPTDEGAGASIRLQQDLPEMDAENIEEIIKYTGSSTQNPDSTIEGHEGAGDVPGFRGIAYIVFDDLQLAQWGNRMPNFSFLVEFAESSDTVPVVLAALLERAGLVSADYDVTGVTADLMTGLSTHGPYPVISIIQSLMFIYGIEARDENGKLVFFDRDTLDTVTVPAEDFCAHSPGSDVPRPFAISDMCGIDLPRQVDIAFSEAAIDYQQGSQSILKINAPGSTAHTLRMVLPFTLTAEQAREIAKRELWTAWGERQKVSLFLPPSYMHLQVFDIIGLTYDGVDYEFLVREINIGHNHMLEVRGVVYHSQVYDQSTVAEAPDTYEVNLYTPPSLLLALMDVAPLRSEDEDVPGFYSAVVCPDVRPPWPGGELWQAWADRRFPNKVVNLEVEAIMGEAKTPSVGTASGNDIWDIESTFTVELFEGSLESDDEENVLNGSNRMMIGGEVIAFQTATLISGKTYELTTLLRGLRNTEYFINLHEIYESVVLLSGSEGPCQGLQFHGINVGDINNERHFRPVPVGEEVFDVKPKIITLQGNTIRPWSPCHIKGERNSSNDLTVTWVRRTRAFMQHFTGKPTPMLEPVENYEAEAY
jgi:hypothetical protein